MRGVAYLHTTLKNIWSHYFTITLEKTNSLEKGYNEDGLFQNILLRLLKKNSKFPSVLKSQSLKNDFNSYLVDTRDPHFVENGYEQIAHYEE